MVLLFYIPKRKQTFFLVTQRLQISSGTKLFNFMFKEIFSNEKLCCFCWCCVNNVKIWLDLSQDRMKKRLEEAKWTIEVVRSKVEIRWKKASVSIKSEGWEGVFTHKKRVNSIWRACDKKWLTKNVHNSIIVYYHIQNSIL